MTLPWAWEEAPGVLDVSGFEHLPYLFMWKPRFAVAQPLTYGVVSAVGAVTLYVLAGGIMVTGGQVRGDLPPLISRLLPLTSYFLPLTSYLLPVARRPGEGRDGWRPQVEAAAAPPDALLPGEHVRA